MENLNNFGTTEKNQTNLLTKTLESNLVNLPCWLTHAEKNFIKVLDSVVNNAAFIFTKVRVNDVLRNATIPDDQRDEYDYGLKTFDFVLCNKRDLSVSCIIELDDRPHALQKMYPEYSYQTLCDEISIALLEISARCGYEKDKLRKSLLPYLNLDN